MVERETRARVVIAVSVDWFFLSHRLPLARALRERGHDVTIAAQETGGRAAIEREGLRFAALPIDRGSKALDREARVVAALVHLYRRVRPHVVHHVSPKPIIYGSIAARIARVPGVINAVSGLGWAFIERGDDTARSRLLRHALTLGYRAAFAGQRTRVIFQNRDDAAALGLGPRLDSRVRMVRGSGVDLTQFVMTPPPDGDALVVLPARILGDKGVREFVAAARMLRARGVTARFVLAGRADPQNPAGIAEAEIATWVRDGVVEWRGHVAREEMPALYRASALVVLPSYREGMPLALAEAAACGRACIATDVPGCREIVRHGETGWLVAPRDVPSLARAIEEALSDPARLREMGQRGRTWAEQEFSLDEVLRRTLEVYDELLG